MTRADSSWLCFEEPEDYDTLRELLLRVNYTAPGVLELAGLKDRPLRGKDVPFLQYARGARPIDTLTRLFISRVPVAEQAMRDAIAPMALETWENAGLLKTENGTVRACLKLVPFDRFVLVQDFPNPDVTVPGELVIGVGGATLTLANAMIRRRARLSLDLGTGCGLLALLKSSESERVIATDRNPRAVRMATFNARINALPNVECREGDMFEPLTGLRFDLILCNAPFVISPSSGYLYLDGGMQGDQFCQQLVRNAAEFLNEGGYCQFLCNWAHLKGQDWQERLAGWFQGTGCDVWVLRGTTDDPTVYAKKWIEHFQPAESVEFGRVYDEWMTYYEREGIEAVSMGLVTMRRKSGSKNWFGIDSEPKSITRDVGEHIIRIFELRDFLTTVQADQSLMNAVLKPPPDLHLNVEFEPSVGGWRAVSRQLQIQTGLGFAAHTDEMGCDFISRCDGRRTVGDVFQEMATHFGIGTDKIVAGSLHVVRHLIERGFLVPAELPVAVSSDTV